MARTRRDDPLLELLSFSGQLADATVPSLAFLVVWLGCELAGLGTAILVGAVAAVVVAVGVAVWRARRGERLWAVVAGVVVAAISAGLALYTGRPEFFFLPRVVANAGSFLAWVVSILVRWPLLGVVVGAVLRRPAAWRRDPDLVRGYQRASWLWSAQYALRLAVFVPLWAAGQTVALGVAQAALTWPLVMICVVLSWPLVRSALPAGHPGPRHPVEPAVAPPAAP